MRASATLPRAGAPGPGLPMQAGIGFKPEHFDALMADPAPPPLEPQTFFTLEGWERSDLKG